MTKSEFVQYFIVPLIFCIIVERNKDMPTKYYAALVSSIFVMLHISFCIQDRCFVIPTLFELSLSLLAVLVTSALFHAQKMSRKKKAIKNQTPNFDSGL